MALGLWAWLGPAAGVAEQRREPAPEELEEVGVSEHLNAQLPLELSFVDSRSRPVKLGRYFDGTRPVLLTMNYSNCPMLCSLQLNGLFDGLKRMPWDLGDQFQMITVSIDPKETPQRAQLTKQEYLKLYGRPGAGAGWHCLTGRESEIRKLAEVIGFRYKYVEQTGQYAHAAVTFVCTPDGRLSRYLYGIEYDPQTLRFSLLEASEGKVGTAMDQVLLFCFQYDATKGRYGPAAVRIMQVGGGLTVLVLGAVLWGFWRRELRRSRQTDRERG